VSASEKSVADAAAKAAGPTTHADEVCAVVVTYHPDADFSARQSRLLRQVGALVIVDNGSDDAEVAMLREFSSAPSVTLVLNQQNLGVARALNIGIQQALALRFPWVLLLDQDSSADDDMVRTLFEVRDSYVEQDRLAVVGAGFRDVNRARETEEVRGEPWEEVESVITSGSLVPMAVHAVIGPFREEFFIDHVDTDYCFRARAKGYRVIKTRKSIMSHAIGAASRHQVLWMDKWTTNHSAERRYYIARNDTIMLHDYGNYAWGLWALKSFSRCLRLCKRIVLYEPMKSRKIAAVAQGWWDGVRGRSGPRGHAMPRGPLGPP
jgi:rhamnosyltransferase